MPLTDLTTMASLLRSSLELYVSVEVVDILSLPGR